MRKLLLAIAVLASGAFFIDTPVHACGDKLVSLIRGIRLQRAYQAAHSASILIYTGQGLDKTLKEETKLESSLKNAGHDIQLVGDPVELNQALRARHFDLVLADASAASGLAQQLSTLPVQARVVPVLYKPSKAQMNAAEQQYGFAIKVPAKSTQHLEAIDEAMK